MELAVENYPYVSIIIPTFNAEQFVLETITSVFSQSYPIQKYEVIIVDNKSTDNTLDILKAFDVKIYSNTIAFNPYLSRNIGMQYAKGEIIVFLDITCTPCNTWLEEGVATLKKGADLVGGQIKYKLSASPTYGEMYDSITFVDVEKYVTELGGTAGGNLFLKRKVWEEIGTFPEDSLGGMDIYWTRKATTNGFKLSYCQKAIVYYPARKLKRLLYKSFREGKGTIALWQKEERNKLEIWWDIFKTFSPPSLKEMKGRIRRRGNAETQKHFYKLWLIAWLAKITMGLGRFAGMFTKMSNKLK